MTSAHDRENVAAPAHRRTDARLAILEVARAEFSEHGQHGVSIRGIANRAGVDPRLVRYYYGSKERLLLQAMQMDGDPVAFARRILRGSPRTLGRRTAAALLALWDDPRTAIRYRARLSASLTSAEAVKLLHDEFVVAFFGTLARAVSPDQHELRASLAASHVLGMALCRYVVDQPVLVNCDDRDLLRQMGSAIQYCLTAEMTPAQQA